MIGQTRRTLETAPPPNACVAQSFATIQRACATALPLTRAAAIEGEAPAPSQDDDILDSGRARPRHRCGRPTESSRGPRQGGRGREESAREREEACLAKAEEARRSLLAAATDELTGAYARRFGLESLTLEIERAPGDEQPHARVHRREQAQKMETTPADTRKKPAATPCGRPRHLGAPYAPTT